MQTYEIGTIVRVNVTFLDENGDPADPTLVVLEVRTPSGITSTIPNVNDGVGLYHGLVPTAENGTWWAQWTGTGAVDAVIEDSFAVVASHVDAPPDPQVGGGIQVGPCTTWATAADVVSCCSSASEAPVDLLETFALECSQLLYELSGRRFSGVCGETVRPCATAGCGLEALGVGIIPGWGGFGGWGYGGWDGPWGWYTDNGIGAAGLVCGCNALSQVTLGYPVNAIRSVKIDGVELDPSEYRVDEYRYLVRLADPATGQERFWPSCQRLDLDDDQPGTWSVDYSFGVSPPVAGVLAAGQLACQMWQQCEGGACTLPVGTTKVIRQGVQIERGLLANWLISTNGVTGWQTGLVHVDAFLNAYNPNRLRRRPAVWTPDLPMMPRRVGT